MEISCIVTCDWLSDSGVQKQVVLPSRCLPGDPFTSTIPHWDRLRPNSSRGWAGVRGGTASAAGVADSLITEGALACGVRGLCPQAPPQHWATAPTYCGPGVPADGRALAGLHVHVALLRLFLFILNYFPCFRGPLA